MGSETGSQPPVPPDQHVPVRTIMVAIGLVLATVVAIHLIRLLAHLEALLIVSAFFATVLTPVVDLVRRRLHVKRGVATTIVFLVGLGLLVAMIYAFVHPLVDQGRTFADDFPTLLEDAREGRGPLGDLVERYDLEQRYEDNKANIEDAIKAAGDRAVDIAVKLFAGIASLLTVLVLTFMMVLYGPEILDAGLRILSPVRQARVKAVATDCARALTGYVMGNLAISVICGSLTFIALWVAGVPFKGVLALWVGFADLIPLVGATLGAIPTIGVAFLHSVPAGIAMTVFYIVYQQFENHILQPAIMARTVHINQLFVLVSVLAGVELFGILGALLAIPAAGVIQVIVRDIWDEHRGRPKPEPSIGADEVPLSQIDVVELGMSSLSAGLADPSNADPSNTEAEPAGPTNTGPASTGPASTDPEPADPASTGPDQGRPEAGGDTH